MLAAAGLAGAAALFFLLSPQSEAADADPLSQVEVTAHQTTEGYIVASARIPAPAAKIRAFIADGVRAHKLAPTTLKVQSAGREGDCQRIHLTVRGLFSPFEIDTKRCRTAKGFHESMVASEDFKAYDVEWVIEEDGDASKISFRALNVLQISVPEGIQLRESKKVMRKTVKNLARALAAE